MGVFENIFMALIQNTQETSLLMIDATHPVSYTHLSYISLPGGGGENYGEILFRQLSPEFLYTDRGHVYLGSTFAATRTPSSHATVRKTGFTIIHPTQTINLAMLGIVDWNNDEKDEWLIACDVRPHLGSESRTYYVLVPPPLRKGEPLQATVAAVYELSLIHILEETS